MSRPAIQLMQQMVRPPERRPTVVVLTSALCLSAWHLIGNYAAWSERVPDFMLIAGDGRLSAAIWSLAAAVLFMGLIPMLVVKLVLRERLADYNVRWGDVGFAVLTCALATPLILWISYSSAQLPVYQAICPSNPLALESGTALAWHLAGQLAFYAAWEFHFRGFLLNGLSPTTGMSAAIWIQALASTLAHFGKPGSELFGALIAGFFWGLLAFRTRSILGSTFQHWLLGAGVDYFVCRSVMR